MTKGDIILDAFAQIRISGITLIPDGGDTDIGLGRLESMMAQLQAGKNLIIGYNFQDIPDPSDPAGIELEHKDMATTNLAYRILSYYGKPIPQPLMGLARSSLLSSIAISVRSRIKGIAYPSRQPIGSGNSRYNGSWDRFYSTDVRAPSSANQIFKGETRTYTATFVDFLLLGQTVSSYVITVDSGLSYSNDSESDGVITYDIAASSGSDEGFRQVRIQVTTSGGTVSKKLVDFNVVDPETIGGN